MKIDLHLHSPHSKISGDSIKWISPQDSLRKLHSRKIKAAAITDHNVFNAKLYQDFQKLAAQEIIIFPGIEIDILKVNEVKAHLLLIFSNKLSNQDIDNLEKISNRELKKRGIRIKKVFEIYEKYDFIVIPHVGKGDFFKPEELDFHHDAIEITNLENANYKRWLKLKNDKSIVAFSDTHIWRDYPQHSKLYTNIDFDGTFKDLKKQLTKNKNYTKEL